MFHCFAISVLILFQQA